MSPQNLSEPQKDAKADRTLDKVLSLFSSPCCRSPMTAQASGISCTSCGKLYSTDEGIFRFITAESSHGEFTYQEMNEFLAAARSIGWKAAVEVYARPRQPRVAGLITDPRRYRSVEMLRDVDGGIVLDLGCGYGGVSRVLAGMFDQVVALDESEQRISFLNLIRQQDAIGHIIPVWHSDAARLPFTDSAFDAVVLIGVLEYLPARMPDRHPTTAQMRCLREFRRVLKPGGFLLIQTKNRFGWTYWLGQRDHSGLAFGPIMPIWLADRLSRWIYHRPYRIVNHSLNGYRSMLTEAGFDNVRFHWPVPGYQTPDYILNLSGNLHAELRAIDPRYHGRLKSAILRFLESTRILSAIVPHYCILAQNPRARSATSNT